MTVSPTVPVEFVEESLAVKDVDGGNLPNEENAENAENVNKRAAGAGTALPVARIKRIMKLDPEIQNISNEAAVGIGIATELFLAFVGKESMTIAQAEKRKGLAYRDLATAVVKSNYLQFLKPIIPAQVTLKEALENRKRLVDENPQLAPSKKSMAEEVKNTESPSAIDTQELDE